MPRRARVAIACALPIVLAAFDSHAATEEPDSEATRGLRAKLGTFVLGHPRQPDESNKASYVFAPGLSLAAAARLGRWELEAQGRGAYFTHSESGSSSRTTLLVGLGGRGTWFAAPHADNTFFVVVGGDLDVMLVDTTGGAGPSAHLGIGLEAWHGRAHGRLAFEVGADALAMRTIMSTSSAAGPPSSSSSTSGFFLVSPSLAGRWTF